MRPTDHSGIVLGALRKETALHLLLGLGLVGGLAAGLGNFVTSPLLYLLQSMLIFGIMACALLRMLPDHLPRTRFGPANRVTLLRAILTALLAGLIGQSSAVLADQAGLIALIALVTVLLDGLDGWVARRSGCASAFGARFDMELDGLVILVLALLALQMGKAGLWVLASGALRYLFLAGQLLWPALARPLPPGRRRQMVCALQSLALVLCLSPFVPAGMSHAVAALGLALLSLSFAIDLAWLLGRVSSKGGVSCS